MYILGDDGQPKYVGSVDYNAIVRKKGLTDDDYANIGKSLFGGGGDAPKSETTKETVSRTKQNQKVVVEKDGQQFNLPENQLQDALDQGYQLIQ